MKYLRQALIILAVTFVGEILSYVIPVGIPASIYGLVLLFVLLCTGLLKLESVKETGKFLVEIMGLMFVPATVGILDCWSMFRESLWLNLAAVSVVTVLVMGVGGLTAQAVIRRTRR